MRVLWVSDVIVRPPRSVRAPIVCLLQTPYAATWTAPNLTGPQLFVGIGDFTEPQLDWLDDYADNNGIDWMYVGMDANDEEPIPNSQRGKFNQILAKNGIPPAAVRAQADVTIQRLSQIFDLGRDFALMKAEFAVNHGRDWR